MKYTSNFSCLLFIYRMYCPFDLRFRFERFYLPLFLLAFILVAKGIAGNWFRNETNEKSIWKTLQYLNLIKIHSQWVAGIVMSLTEIYSLNIVLLTVNHIIHLLYIKDLMFEDGRFEVRCKVMKLISPRNKKAFPTFYTPFQSPQITKPHEYSKKRFHQ